MQGTAGGRKDTSIVLEGLLGEGTFGKVYKGELHIWQTVPNVRCTFDKLYKGACHIR
jgi:hypothetical protein